MAKRGLGWHAYSPHNPISNGKYWMHVDMDESFHPDDGVKYNAILSIRRRIPCDSLRDEMITRFRYDRIGNYFPANPIYMLLYTRDYAYVNAYFSRPYRKKSYELFDGINIISHRFCIYLDESPDDE